MKLIYFSMLFIATSTIVAKHEELTKVARGYEEKGNLCKKENNMAKALEYYKNAIALDPSNFMLIFNTANELYNNGLNEEALVYYDLALTLRTDIEQIHFNKGIVLTQLHKDEAAAECYMQAINTNRQYERAYIHAGSALEKCNKHDAAIIIYRRGLDIYPNNAEFHYRIGLALKHKDCFHEAIAELRTAQDLDPKNLIYKLELANALHLIDGSEEALWLYEQILEVNPNNHHVLYNLWYTIKKMGHIEKAMQIYDKVLEMDGNYALARFSRSLGYLTLGDWENGWKEYEWRWDAYNDSPKKFDHAPVWDGSDLAGKRILLYAEQGLGDTIQFIRYGQLVKDLGAYVIVETQAPLKDVLKSCSFIDELYSRGERLPHFDTQIALMSLPMIFDTMIDTVPHDIPYIKAKPELIDHWREQLSHDHNFKIGICWQGNPNYSTQFLRQAVAGKSMHVTHFEPIARLKGVSVYNLQKMGGEEQLSELSADVEIKSFGTDFDSSNGRFMDTLAIMKNLDLIITIDTGTCHIAGALGVPTWNLLPNPADWRWMIDRNDTPWYNNMRLFKQPKPGDWSSVIEECVAALVPILYGEKTVEEVTQEKGVFKTTNASVKIHNNLSLEHSLTLKTEPIHAKTTPINAHSPHTFESLETEQKQMATSQPPVNTQLKLQTTKNIHEHGRLHHLTMQLAAIQKQLIKCEAKMQNVDRSVFNDEFVELMQQCVELHQQKNVIDNEIHEIKNANKR